MTQEKNAYGEVVNIVAVILIILSIGLPIYAIKQLFSKR